MAIEDLREIDEGHRNLVYDLDNLLDEAKEMEFHDFKNKKYAAPKVELARQLEMLRVNVLEGRYDN